MTSANGIELVIFFVVRYTCCNPFSVPLRLSWLFHLWVNQGKNNLFVCFTYQKGAVPQVAPGNLNFLSFVP